MSMSINEIKQKLGDVAANGTQSEVDYWRGYLDATVAMQQGSPSTADTVHRAVTNEPQGYGWISVEDALPKGGEEVLVYTAWHEAMNTLKVVYLNGEWWRSPGMHRLPSVPTHWRPLPEPPKEE